MKFVLFDIGTNDSRLRGARFLDCECSEKLLTADFKRRVCMEEQNAQRDNRFLGGTIAHMICAYFKISGAGEALLDFNDTYRVQLKNDNVQGIETKWDEVLLSVT